MVLVAGIENDGSHWLGSQRGRVGGASGRCQAADGWGGSGRTRFGDGWLRRVALPICSSRARYLWDALSAGFTAVGFDKATGGDEVFKQLVLAWLIEPTSKLEAIWVLQEAGISAPAYRRLKRRLPGYAEPRWRRRLAAACAAHVGLGSATLALYNVSTLYFETDTGD